MKMLRNCRPDTQVVRRLDYESWNPGFNPRPGQIFLWIIRMFGLGPSGNVSFKNIQFSFLIRGTETILLSFTKVIHHYHHISCRMILPGHKSPPSFPVTAALTMSSVRLVGGRPTVRLPIHGIRSRIFQSQRQFGLRPILLLWWYLFAYVYLLKVVVLYFV